MAGNLSKKTNSTKRSETYINITMRERMIRDLSRTLGTIGTLCFLTMPYLFGTDYFLFLAVGGNLCLLPQVYRAKQYNLVLLNIVGGGRYLYELIYFYVN